MKIDIKYSLPNRDVDLKSIEVSGPCEIGLPKGTVAFKPKAGDTAYSGSHDTGPLCRPREGGVMATVIHGVQRAKELNDAFLTSVIEEQQQTSNSPPTKKLKADDKD